MSENKAEKYSNQCFVAQTGKKTMSVDSYLTEPADNGLTPPLTMLSDFSRFRVTIINFSTEPKKYVFANILAKSELPYIVDQYRAVVNNTLMFNPEPLPIAYTQKFIAGNFAGMSPAEVLIGDETRREELSRTQDYLRNNLAKYPKNQNMIDAIDNALYLFDSGELYERSSITSFVIFNKEFKRMSGNKIQASIRIEYEPSMDFPWTITISNSDIVSINGDKVETKDKRSEFYRLSSEQMASLIRAMDDLLSAFKNNHYEQLQKRANDASWKPESHN